MKTAVFVFGRFNPPTIGHEKLLNALTATAQREGGKALVYTSSTQDAKKNPPRVLSVFESPGSCEISPLSLCLRHNFYQRHDFTSFIFLISYATLRS